MEGSNTVIDNRPSVKVFYDCDHLSEADFVSVLLGIEEDLLAASPMMFRQSIAVPY